MQSGPRPEPDRAPEGPATDAPVRLDRAGWGPRLTGILTLLAFLVAYVARDLLLPVVLALLLKFLLAPLVRALHRVGIPEALGAGVVVLGLVATLGLGASQLGEPLQEWVESAPETLRQVRYRLQHLRGPMDEVRKAAEEVENMASPDQETLVVRQDTDLVGTVLVGTQQVVGGLAVVLVLTYFLLAAGDLFLRKLVRVLPRLSDKKRAVEIAHRLEHDVSRYLLTITVINAGLGAVTGLALWALGMPNPVLWGVLVAVLNYVPYLGAMANAAIVGIVALMTFDDVGRALLVPAVSFTLTSLEGQFLTPLVLGRSLTLNPVVIFLALIFCVWMWGVPGALLAVPLLSVVKILGDSVEALAPVGEFVGR